jgi:hypothetical protein
MQAVSLLALLAPVAFALAASPLLFGGPASFPALAKSSAAISNFFSGIGNFDFKEAAAINKLTTPKRRRLSHTERLQDIKILFVLDPNFFLCWETVPIDNTTKVTLLPWIASLKDVFDAGPDKPDGADLKV